MSRNIVHGRTRPRTGCAGVDPRIWFASIVLSAVIQLAASAEQVVFTIDPLLSELTFSGHDAVYGPFVEQGVPGSGSLATSVAGHFLVDFDPFAAAPASLVFVANHGWTDLLNSGNWLPGPDPASDPPGSLVNAAPAEFAGRTAGDEVLFASRDLVWEWRSDPQSPVPLDPIDGTFDETQVDVKNLQGGVDLFHQDVPPNYLTLPYTGGGPMGENGVSSLVEDSPGQWTLTINGRVTRVIGPLTGIWEAKIVATALFDAANVDQVDAGENNGSALGGSNTTGGVDVVFDNVVVGGTLNVQQIATEGLPHEAIAAIETVANFKTAGDTPQIWDVSFDGSFSGPLTLTFGYDPSLLGSVAETDLFVWHFDGGSGNWEKIFGTVDTELNTITIDADSLSPFALGVPEPSTLLLLSVGVLCGCVYRLRVGRPKPRV